MTRPAEVAPVELPDRECRYCAGDVTGVELLCEFHRDQLREERFGRTIDLDAERVRRRRGRPAW